MDAFKLQKLSVRAFTFWGRLIKGIQDWIMRHPRFSKWVFRYPEELDQDEYAHSNREIFSKYGEQERMLYDKQRMQFYHDIIQRHVEDGDVVVDLGTGTGILAAFASWQGARKVYAIDHSKIIEQARILAEHNKLKNVEFLSVNSREFSVSEPVDTIIHEQMGDVLFDEDMVANVIDMRDRLLKEGGKILPARFEFYCEPVQLRDNGAAPFIWNLNVHGYDYSPLKDNPPSEQDYYDYSSTDPTLVNHFLCDPMPLMTIDLHTLRRSDLPVEWSVGLPVVKAGRMDGYAVFFKALVDDDLVLSTSPLDAGRAPHWGFYVLRTDKIEVQVGDVIDMSISAENGWPDVASWRWEQTKYTAEQYRDCMS
jgi:protein arginine N-methyltransferase 1